jgi:hypothetical protein
MIRRKLELYVLSLWLLFLFIIVITINLPSDWETLLTRDGWILFLKENVVSVTSLIFLLYGVFAWIRFNFELNGSTNLPFKVNSVEDINYEHLIFLATYVIPLISFNFESIRYLIVLSGLLVVMGVIYIKTDMFYANPSLALLGFRIYKVSGSFKNNEERSGIIILSRSTVSQKDKLSYIKLDERIYYAKKVNNEQG